jgi:peptidoglycan biosynthesis protein MviN/MurJ (putative lipid II flippase)
VGIASVGIYLVVALLLLNPLGYLGLVLADSAKHTGHVLIMLLLLRRRLGSLQSLHAGVTLLKTSLASVAMAAVLLVLTPLLGSRLPAGFEGNLIVVVASAAVGAAVYAAGVLLLQVDEARLLLDRLLRRRRPPTGGTPA